MWSSGWYLYHFPHLRSFNCLFEKKKSVTWPRTGRESVWRSVDREEGTGLAATYGRPGGDSLSLKVTFWMNSHHARGKLLRRRLGRQDCEPPPLLSSPDQKAWCKVFRTQCGFFALERRSWWCPRCQGTWVHKSFSLRNAFAWKVLVEEYNRTWVFRDGPLGCLDV